MTLKHELGRQWAKNELLAQGSKISGEEKTNLNIVDIQREEWCEEFTQQWHHVLNRQRLRISDRHVYEICSELFDIVLFENDGRNQTEETK